MDSHLSSIVTPASHIGLRNESSPIHNIIRDNTIANRSYPQKSAETRNCVILFLKDVLLSTDFYHFPVQVPVIS